MDRSHDLTASVATLPGVHASEASLDRQLAPVPVFHVSSQHVSAPLHNYSTMTILPLISRASPLLQVGNAPEEKYYESIPQLLDAVAPSWQAVRSSSPNKTAPV